MCEDCQTVVYTKEKDRLEYIGTRSLNDLERYYYRCPKCDQGFYWMDWCAPGSEHIEPLKVNASEIMVLFQE